MSAPLTHLPVDIKEFKNPQQLASSLWSTHFLPLINDRKPIAIVFFTNQHHAKLMYELNHRNEFFDIEGRDYSQVFSHLIQLILKHKAQAFIRFLPVVHTGSSYSKEEKDKLIFEQHVNLSLQYLKEHVNLGYQLFAMTHSFQQAGMTHYHFDENDFDPAIPYANKLIIPTLNALSQTLAAAQDLVYQIPPREIKALPDEQTHCLFGKHYNQLELLKTSFLLQGTLSHNVKHGLYIKIIDALIKFSQKRNDEEHALQQEIEINNKIELMQEQIKQSNNQLTLEALIQENMNSMQQKNKALQQKYSIEEFIAQHYDLVKPLNIHGVDIKDFHVLPDVFYILSELSNSVYAYNLNILLPEDLKNRIALQVLVNQGVLQYERLCKADMTYNITRDCPLISLLLTKTHLLNHFDKSDLQRFVKLYHQIQSINHEQYTAWQDYFRNTHDQDPLINPEDVDQLGSEELFKILRPNLSMCLNKIFLTVLVIESLALNNDINIQSINLFNLIESNNKIQKSLPKILQHDTTLSQLSVAIIEGDDVILDQVLSKPIEDDVKSATMVFNTQPFTLLSLACQFGSAHAVKQLIANQFVLFKEQSLKINVHQCAVLLIKYQRDQALKKLMDEYAAHIVEFDTNDAVNPLGNVYNNKRFQLLKPSDDNVDIPSEKQPCRLVTAAITTGNTAVLKALIKKGQFNPEKNDLLYTIFHDDADTLAVLLRYEKFSLTTTFKDGIYDLPLLHIACAHQSVNVVATLLSFGADANKQVGGYRQTPLMRAAQTGNSKLCQLLIKNGAKPTIRDSRQWTASAYASSVIHKTCFDQLANFLKNIEKNPEQITHFNPSPL